MARNILEIPASAIPNTDRFVDFRPVAGVRLWGSVTGFMHKMAEVSGATGIHFGWFMLVKRNTTNSVRLQKKLPSKSFILRPWRWNLCGRGLVLDPRSLPQLQLFGKSNRLRRLR